MSIDRIGLDYDQIITIVAAIYGTVSTTNAPSSINNQLGIIGLRLSLQRQG
jgi:hypothetical protein